MSKYVWTDDMREISGFGGGYEGGCRVMVTAGLEWFDAHQDIAEPLFKEYKNITGLIIETNPTAKALTKAMCDAADRAYPDGGVTGAMVQFCVHHVFKARSLGWPAYVAMMQDMKRQESPET